MTAKTLDAGKRETRCQTGPFDNLPTGNDLNS